MSKDEILETYFNIIYVGPNVYGVKMGAKYYFDKELQDLVLSIHYACLDYFNQKNISKLYANQNNDFLSFDLSDK